MMSTFLVEAVNGLCAAKPCQFHQLVDAELVLVEELLVDRNRFFLAKHGAVRKSGVNLPTSKTWAESLKLTS